jgi:hypothetical protein
MRVLNLFWSFGLLAAALSAQPAAGIPPEWETRKLLDSLVSNASKLEPLVGEINPADWKQKGAPDAYQAQWKSVRTAIAGLKGSATQLAQEPTRLSLVLDTLFRLDGLNTYLGSLAAGIRKYQNPALADILLGAAGENSANRENLKQYALDLASTKEGELKVMESEAQRCLSTIVKQAPAAAPQPAAAPKSTPKENK